MKKLNLLLFSTWLCTIATFAQSGNVGIGTNTPTSRLQVNGSVSFGYRVVTASTTLDAGDYTVEFNGTSAATLTLPDATTCRGRTYHIKNLSTTVPTPVVTLAPQSGQTEDSKSSWYLDTKNEIANMMSDGSNWHVYAQMVPTAKSDSTGGSWLEGGNSEQSTATKKFGTVTNNDLPIITNNTERMRINTAGNVGIGTSSPAYKLDVSGAARCTGALTIGGYTLPNADGTSNQVLTTGGSGAVTWQSLSAIVTAGWSLSGNSGTTPGTHFIGTTDNQSLVFKANNVQAGKIDLPLSNTSFGYQSAAAVTTATAGTYIGYQAGFKNTTGGNNTAVGTVALSNNTTGASNTAIGSNALKLATTASGNTAVGNSSQLTTTTGGSNTSVGAYSMQSNTTGSSNTAQGYSSLGANTTGTNNTGVGGGALQTNTTGLSNTAHGSGALQFSTTANNNTSVGAFSSQYTTTGASNTALGYGALGTNTTGGFNTTIGNVAGATNTTGTNNTFLGSSADASSAALTNAAAIGYNAKVATSNSMVLGGTGSYAVNVGIGTNSPAAKLDVANGVTTTNSVVNATGSINDYLQYNIQNTSTGTAAQSGYSATADNGSNTTGFAWIGINNSTFNFPTAYNIGGPNDVSYIGSGQDMYIANANNTKSIIFSTGTAVTPYFAEKMRITNAGNVGIGTMSPSAKLEVSSGISGTSGLKFTNMNSASTTATSSLLGVDATGNVVVSSLGSVFTGATASVAGTSGLIPAPAAGNQNKFLTGSGGWAQGFPLITANGASTATTETRDFNAWVTKGTGFYITDVVAPISNPIPNESAWFNFSQTASNGGYFAQTALNDHNFYYRGGASASVSAAVWNRMLSLPSTSQTKIAVDAVNNATLNNVDNGSLSFATNNISRVKIDSLGNMGVGTTTPASQLDVADGVTTNNTVVNATGSINDFLQYNIQNTSAGTHAQSGYSATADNGTNTTGFAWLGINNSTFNYPTPYNIGGANDVSYIGSGQDMYIANANNTKSIIFSTGIAASPYFAEKMRITNAGNVGINTTSPAAQLDVAGTYKLGTSGTVLTNMIKTSVSITDNTAFNQAATETVTATVTGATVNATVILNPRTALPAGISIAWVRVSSANTISIGFANSDILTHTIGSVTLDVTVIQ